MEWIFAPADRATNPSVCFAEYVCVTVGRVLPPRMQRFSELLQAADPRPAQPESCGSDGIPQDLATRCTRLWELLGMGPAAKIDGGVTGAGVRL